MGEAALQRDGVQKQKSQEANCPLYVLFYPHLRNMEWNHDLVIEQIILSHCKFHRIFLYEVE
jgi:hypothetical protein